MANKVVNNKMKKSGGNPMSGTGSISKSKGGKICQVCSRPCKNSRGLKIHLGKMHKKNLGGSIESTTSGGGGHVSDVVDGDVCLNESNSSSVASVPIVEVLSRSSIAEKNSGAARGEESSVEVAMAKSGESMSGERNQTNSDASNDRNKRSRVPKVENMRNDLNHSFKQSEDRRRLTLKGLRCSKRRDINEESSSDEDSFTSGTDDNSPDTEDSSPDTNDSSPDSPDMSVNSQLSDSNSQ